MTTELNRCFNFQKITSYGSIIILVFTAGTMFVKKWQREND